MTDRILMSAPEITEADVQAVAEVVRLGRSALAGLYYSAEGDRR